MKVLMPTSCFFPKLGGIEIALHNIAKRLIKKGHDPILLIPFGSYIRLFMKRKQFPYKIIPLPPKLNIFLLEPTGILTGLLDVYFLALQNIYKFDIWHINGGYPIGVASIRFSSKHNIPHLVCCHGADIQIDKNVNYGLRIDSRVDKLVRKWLPKADALVAISNTVVKEYESINVESSKIFSIPNGVDIDRLSAPVDKNEIRKMFNIDSDDFVMLTVGRYHPKKNFESIIRIAKTLKTKVDFNFKFLIFGSGNECLNDIINKECLSDVVRIIPNKSAGLKFDELPDNYLISIYRLSDIFIFPSFIETFGIVLIEAMAAGLPVITSDGPGCIDIVEGGMCGRVIPPLNIDQYANEIIFFKNNKDMMTSYQHLGKERASQFSWDIVVEKYCDLYKKLVKTKPQVLE